MTHHTFARSPARDFLFKYLQDHREEMDVHEYATLNAIAGRDVQHDRGPLDGAIKDMLSEHAIHYTCIRGVGIKRATSAETMDTADTAANAMRRRTRKVIRQLATVDYNTLEDVDKRRHCVAATRLQLMELCSGRKAKNRIEAVATDTPKMSIDETLKLFSKVTK